MKDRRVADIQPEVPTATPTAAPLDAEALFRQHAHFVAGFLVRLGARRDEIDDLVQEVFLVAHRRGGYAPGPARPTTWLAEIALRVAGSSGRARRRRSDQPDQDAVEAAPARDPSPFEAAAGAQALARIQRALDALDLDHRAVFLLYELEGEPCDAIAAALSIPIGTVYSRLHTARRAVRAAYTAPEPRVAPRRTAQGAL